jgi:DNA polymerase III epsilon subunit-like protein
LKKNFGVVVDFETTGIRSQETPWNTYLEGPQGIEIGAVLVELPMFEPIAEFSTRIKFVGSHNGITYGGPLHENLTWSDDAEVVHGISLHDLVNEPLPVEVAWKFSEFILTNAKIPDAHKQPVMLCGHNIAGDAYYIRQMMFLGGVERDIRFHHRMLDSFTLGYMLLGAKSSNELFQRVSSVVRDKHNAMQDARLTLAAFRHLQTICQKIGSEQLQ